ncbi:hypothetical protein JJL45_11835 [Tamlana sp. s12]|uniref:hypothetical protein n=1 Tax=Tamlana sp. s12 TaxID=1630406 RepID=UPI0008005F66|nr:hypothetical protein [Tamlana sp. s12]OBQ50302.1 hypothetical protein VQ01_15395 [Tamlana sp. s12]QQY81613.1 hypothetical protein JJL45_11835 [Tamlana sp. s12]
MKKILSSILIFTCINCVLGQEKENLYVGKWITEPNANGMINLINLNHDGSGIAGPGVYKNGKIELSRFMKSDLKDWKIEKDTLTLITKPIPRGNNREPKSITLIYIILEKENNKFTAYYSDPEMDKMMEAAGEKAEPIKLEFKKME